MEAAAVVPRTVEFGGLRIDYDDRVLAPRRWTQLQSRWAAELALHARPAPLVEFCAGAGQIGLLAAVLSGRPLIQVEADPIAAGWARRNARAAGQDVDLRVGDLRSALHDHERVPLIVADPPYLPSSHVERWPDDPRTAVDGGADGLDLARAVLDTAARHQDAGDSLLLQTAGAAQAHVLAAGAAGMWQLAEIRAHDDERCVARFVRR